MNNILIYTEFDTEQALDLYGVTLLEDFNVENPTLQNILAYVDQDKTADTTLTKQDKQDILMLALQSEDVIDVRERYLSAFTVDGIFGINISQIRDSGLFTTEDILEMDDPELINKLKNLYHKLQNYAEVIQPITGTPVIKNGVFNKLNPDEFVQSSYDLYLGATTTEEVLQIAQNEGDDVVLNDPSLVPFILDLVRNKQSVQAYEESDYFGQIVPKLTNDTIITLQQTLDTAQDFSPFIQQVEFLRGLPIDSYVYDLQEVSQYLQNLEKQAVKLGLNLNNLSDTVGNRTYEETLDFFDGLYNFLIDVQNGNSESLLETVADYSELYDAYFSNTPVAKNEVVDISTTGRPLLFIESNATEESLFRDYSILKIRDNIYQRITDETSLDGLYDLLLQFPELLPAGTLSSRNAPENRDLLTEDIDTYVSELAKEYLTEASDIDTVKKMVVYKILEGVDTVTEDVTVGNVQDLNVDNFLIQFNKDILNNEILQDIFYFSNRGLEAKRTLGEYTNRQLQNELSPTRYQQLLNYAKLSGNASLEYLAGLNVDNTVDSKRDYFANNMNQLPVYTKEYYTDNGYVVTNSNEEFIKVKQELYENVSPFIYAKVETDGRYRNSGLEAPNFDNSITPNITGISEGKTKVKRTKIENDNIEFC